MTTISNYDCNLILPEPKGAAILPVQCLYAPDVKLATFPDCHFAIIVCDALDNRAAVGQFIRRAVQHFSWQIEYLGSGIETRQTVIIMRKAITL